MFVSKPTKHAKHTNKQTYRFQYPPIPDVCSLMGLLPLHMCRDTAIKMSDRTNTLWKRHSVTTTFSSITFWWNDDFDRQMTNTWTTHGWCAVNAECCPTYLPSLQPCSHCYHSCLFTRTKAIWYSLVMPLSLKTLVVTSSHLTLCLEIGRTATTRWETVFGSPHCHPHEGDSESRWWKCITHGERRAFHDYVQSSS